MRGATECAKRLKLLFSSLRSDLGKVSHAPASDPITQMILGVLSRNTPETKAQEGLDRFRGIVVDYNELRVVPSLELADLISDFPDNRLKAEDVSRALNAVFATEHAVTLERIAQLNKKEMLAALEEIDGLEAYSRARIRLLGLGQHAIPLDEAMWAYLRQQEVVDQRCPLIEAQQFLERQIAAEDAHEFVALVKKQAWSEFGTAVKNGEVERILSIPPDRTSRNMLQMVSASLLGAEEVEAPAPADVASEPEPEPEPSKSSAKTKRAGRTKRAKGTAASQKDGSSSAKSTTKGTKTRKAPSTSSTTSKPKTAKKKAAKTVKKKTARKKSATRTKTASKPRTTTRKSTKKEKSPRSTKSTRARRSSKAKSA